MKIKLSIFIFVAILPFSKHGVAANRLPEGTDSLRDSLSAHVNIAVSKIGLPPLPVPPLESPCLSVFLSAKKGNWSYEPDITLAMNAKPWMINNWVHYRFFKKKKLQLSAGLNPFFYFGNNPPMSQREPMISNLNLSAGLFAEYKWSSHWSVNLDFRHDIGFNNQVPTGKFHCVSLSNLSDISTSLYMRIVGHAIYFDYPGCLRGLFGSGEMILGSKRFPVSITFQAIEPLVCQLIAAPFIWNTALVFSL